MRLILLCSLCLALLIVQRAAFVTASGMVYINSDGSVDPPTAPISTSDKLTYFLTGNINENIRVLRANIVLEGAGFTIKGNGAEDIDYNGIELRVSNVTIRNVSVKNFFHGIYLYWSAGNTLHGNNVTENIGESIFLECSSSNTISENNITANFIGIWLHWSHNNVIFHNSFFGNTFIQAANDESYGNKWDDGFPSGGNYWSDYTGIDYFGGPYQNETGSDGLGDTPYLVDSDNIDHYPLMNPIVIPEFPVFLLPFLMAATLLAIVVCKAINRVRNKSSVELQKLRVRTFSVCK